jgi:uncharacterized cupredoxin-like copper-binding protein
MQPTLLLMALTLGAASLAQAHGDAHGTAPHVSAPGASAPTPFGRPGDAAKVSRTVAVAMHDTMRFSPASIEVRRGETVRFVVTNRGQVLHEMVLGTDADLRQHAALMRKFPEMEHDDPNMVHVKPGATGDLVWLFDQAGEFGFACLIPGHFEAGMTGKVVVK